MKRAFLKPFFYVDTYYLHRYCSVLRLLFSLILKPIARYGAGVDAAFPHALNHIVSI